MKRISILLLAAIASFAVPACSNDPTSGDDAGDDGGGSGSGSADEWQKELDKRVVDYNFALRIASLRLTGDLPTMAEIQQVAGAPDNDAKKAAYEALLTNYMSRPAFARQMLYFWRDTFKMGGTPVLEFAPTFAAKLTVENDSYTKLLTATTGACPTLDVNTGVFTAGDCAGAGPKAGVLTDAGAMQLYYGNFAFRRMKWINEAFDCTKFPVELGGPPQDVGNGKTYTGPWALASIAGTANGGRIDFQDTKAVICMNCHGALNHMAPLFANYDEMGAYQPNIVVKTPLDGAPVARLSDYLPAGQTFHWRFAAPTADIPAFGAAMAADPSIAKCGVARLWNFAMGKLDVVDSLVEVPLEVIQPQVDAFTASGFKLKDMIFSIFTSDAFIKF